MPTGNKGIDVRQTGNRLIFRVLLQDSSNAILTTGTTSLYLYELQTDGTLKSYDFNDNTFKSTALTTATQAMTHRTGNNGGTNTGLWTTVLSTLTGFTTGAIYFSVVTNSGASPAQQVREFQYGSAEGNLVVDSAGLADANAVKVGPSGSGATQTAGDVVGLIGALWTTALSESYRATGAAGTPAQLLHEIIAHLGDSEISGTTKTINNRAGTGVKTYTLNSATSPSSIEETT